MYHTFIFSSFLTWHQMEKTEGRLEKKVAKIFFFFIKFIEPRKTKKEDERRKKVRVNQEFLPLLPLCLHVYLSNQIWIRRASQVVSRSYILEKVFFVPICIVFLLVVSALAAEERTYVPSSQSVR